MSNYRFDFYEGFCYHVFNRGLNKQKIFFKEKDFNVFMNYFNQYSIQHQKDLDIQDYCILSNHFHFLILNKKKGLNISRFMKKLEGAYAMFLKKEYGSEHMFSRGLRVFEGRFKAKLIDSVGYYERCQAYILYNAVNHNYVKKPEHWRWSSFLNLPKDKKNQVKTIWNTYFVKNNNLYDDIPERERFVYNSDNSDRS